jgi:poly(3-hydroxybutyrate) depolymerase
LASGGSKKAIAMACTLSATYSSQTITALLEALQKSLERGVIDDSCIQCSDALSYVLRNGGNSPARAYHDSPSSSAVLKSLGGEECVTL